MHDKMFGLIFKYEQYKTSLYKNVNKVLTFSYEYNSTLHIMQERATVGDHVEELMRDHLINPKSTHREFEETLVDNVKAIDKLVSMEREDKVREAK